VERVLCVYENVKRLFKVEVDGTEVQVVWKHSGEVFLQLDTEQAREWESCTQEQRAELLVLCYGDLLAEHLASWISDILPV
jgi:hypothetical protein